MHVSFSVIQDEIPDISKELTEMPETVINCFGLAMHQVICSTKIGIISQKLSLVPFCHIQFVLRTFHVADSSHRPRE